MYQYGLGTTTDYVKAAELFRKSAKQGFNAGQYKLGWMYEHGLGVPQNYDTAIYWYEKAAAQGHATAQTCLQNLREEMNPTPLIIPLATKLPEPKPPNSSGTLHTRRSTPEQ